MRDHLSLKLALFPALAGLLTAANAHAADLTYPIAPATPIYGSPNPVIDNTWSGFYAGATVGGQTIEDLTLDFDDYALTGGGQAGYLHQLGMFVVGAEVQGLWSDDLQFELTPDAGLSQNWSVAAKGRAGIALGDLLVYGTGGAVLSELKPTGTNTEDAHWQHGAVFGGGVEHKLGESLSLRAEYLQARHFDVQSTVGGAGREDDLTNHSVSLGVNYRF